MMWYKDTKNTFIRVNLAAAKAFGKPIEEIEGKSASDLFPEMAETYYKDDMEVIKTGTPKIGIVEQMPAATGEVLCVQTDKIPLKYAQGEVTGVLVFAVDITERKQANEALRESEQFLDNIVEQIPDMIIVKDAENLRFVRFNKAGEDLLGYSREELPSQLTNAKMQSQSPPSYHIWGLCCPKPLTRQPLCESMPARYRDRVSFLIRAGLAVTASFRPPAIEINTNVPRRSYPLCSVTWRRRPAS